MKRRHFIGLLGAAALSPVSTRAQVPDRTRSVGMLMGVSRDAEGAANAKAFRERLQQLGWTEGRNLRIEERWGEGNIDVIRAAAAELVRLAPDAILTFGIRALSAQHQLTRTIPIVFLATSDLVKEGYVKSIARPSGNATGFLLFELSIVGKYLEVLKESAPRLARAGLFVNSDNPSLGAYKQEFEDAARRLGVISTVINVRHASEIEPALADFAAQPEGGLVVPPDVFMGANRKQIINLAAAYRLPAIYQVRYFAVDGGLMSYGVDYNDLLQHAASYIDRILRGANPGDLPVQAPTKFQLVINLKAAKALGLSMPQSVLALADELIE